MSTPQYSDRYIYVPAAPGWEAVNVFEVLDLDNDKTLIEMDTFPVIAWRINETTYQTRVDGFLGFPVLAGADWDGLFEGEWAIHTPSGGKVWGIRGRFQGEIFPSVDEFFTQASTHIELTNLRNAKKKAAESLV